MNVIGEFKPLVGDVHHSQALGVNAFELNIPLHAGSILIQAVTQNIRFTLDGRTPTAASGFQLRNGEPPLLVTITKNTLLKFFREASGAVLEYVWGE